ncbi:MAG: hypothetical protein WC022_00575 [Parcubacteria group bacterium]
MYTDDDLKNLSGEDKKRQSRNFQMQIIVLDSDNRKVENRKNMLDAEIRKLRVDQERMRIKMDEKKKEYDEAVRQILKNEEDMKRLKKKMNLL